MVNVLTASGSGVEDGTTFPRRQLLLCVVPVILIVWVGWSHRWTSDDGFVNFRVIRQIWAGNGPVFNMGERVEAATSPLWVGLLLVGDAVLPLRIEWIAALAAIFLTASGVAFAELGAVTLWRRAFIGRVIMPAGVLVFVALPPVWDFTTSGLESGLSIGWLGASWAVLVRTVLQGGRPKGGRSAWWVCVLVGLGPLVRLDLGLMTVGFVAVLVLFEKQWRYRVRVAAFAFGAPVAYEFFRMAYYAAIVPNTAIAKEAGRSDWGRGWRYFLDFATPYHLWIPLVLLFG